MQFRFVIGFAVLLVVSGSGRAAAEPEEEFIGKINEIDNEQSVHLFGGLFVEKVRDARNVPLSPKETILDRVQRYLDNHELQFDYSFEDHVETERSDGVSESRTRKLKKILLPLALALKMKLAVVISLMLMVVKAISLKALAVGTLALLFSGASFFKDLISGKKDHVTTAYITGAPLNAEIVHSDWSRNGQVTGQDLAYNYHTIPPSGYRS